MMENNDPFPPEIFDPWADSYDAEVAPATGYPFDGYHRLLDLIVQQADVRTALHVLDLGTGTANLALKFSRLGCRLWCTDFSEKMLEKARVKLPNAVYVLADLRKDWPEALERQFDRIVSAYVFHHMELDHKVSLIRRLVDQNLTPGGRIVIGDLSFSNEQAQEIYKQSAGDQWEDEYFWIVDQSLPALERAGLKADYIQVSQCAGVYTIQA